MAAAGVAFSLPANAEGVYIGAGPVGVGVRNGYYQDGWRSHCAYDDDDAVVVRRLAIIIRCYGEVRKIRRCW